MPRFDIVAELQLRAQNVRPVVGQITDQLRGITANVNVNTGPALAGVNRLNSGLGATQSVLQSLRSQAATTNSTLAATVSITQQGASAFAQFGEQAGLAARRFTAFTVAAGSMVEAVRGIREGIRAAVEFQLSMNKVEQVSSETKSTIAGLQGTITSLSTSLGVSSAALAETSITLKQAGLTAGQTADALRALALTDLAPTFENMKQSTEGLIAAFRQFNLSSRDFESTLSSLNAVSAQFAVESSDLVTAIQKAGGAFKFSAGEFKSGSDALNEFVALFTSVRATTRESADAIATGLRTVFTRFQRQDTVKALQDLGVNLRHTREEADALGDTNLQDQFVGAYDAVKRLSEGLAGLRETDPRYAQVIEQLGGYRQISRVIPLLKEFKSAQEALNTAQYGQISLQIAAEKRQETLAAKTSKLKEEYLALFRSIVDSKGFQGLANNVLFLGNQFATLLDNVRPLLPLLTAIAAVKVGTGVGDLIAGARRAVTAPPGANLGKQGNVLRFATGGRVPGQGNTDSVPALLTPGEVVIRKRAAERVGYAKLRDVNDTSDYVPQLPKAPEREGPRKPYGPRANDTLIQALEILTRKRFADGDIVPGTGNGDTVPAYLTPGEFVIKKDSALKIGYRKLRELNRNPQRFATGGQVRGYADGGEVAEGEVKTVVASLIQNLKSLDSTVKSSAIERLRARQQERGVVLAPAPTRLRERNVSAEYRAQQQEFLSRLSTPVLEAPAEPEAPSAFGQLRTQGQVGLYLQHYDKAVSAAKAYARLKGPAGVQAGTTGALDTVVGEVLAKLVADNKILPGGQVDRANGRGEISVAQFVGGEAARQYFRGRSAEVAALRSSVYLKPNLAETDEERLTRLVDATPPSSQGGAGSPPRRPPIANGGSPPPPPPPPGPPAPGEQPAGRSLSVRTTGRSPAQREADRLGLTLENYLSLLRTESAGERRVRERAFAGGNQPEQTFQVQQAILSRRNPVPLVSDSVGEIARSDALFASFQSRRQNDATLDRAISNRQSGRFALGAGLGNGLSAVSPVLAGRFTDAASYNPLDPVGGDRELRRQRVLGSLAAQRAGEDRLSNFRDRAQAANERANAFLSRNGANVAFGTLAVGGSLGADYLERRAGSAEVAAQSTSTTNSFTNRRSAAGALQFAAIGAGVGLATGNPLLGAIGAATGAVYGFYSALKEAEGDIRQAKINNALTELSSKLTSFASGIPEFSELAGIRTQLADYNKSARDRALENSENSYFFEPYKSFDAQKFGESFRADLRKDFGPLLPQVGQGLTRAAERIGRENTGTDSKVLIERLKADNGGANEELIQKIANVRGTSVASESEKLRKAIVEAQQSAVREQQARRGRESNDANINTFGRLYQAVQSASDSLQGLQSRASALAAVLDGTVSSSRVSAGIDGLQNIGVSGGLGALRLAAGVGGSAGQRLLSSGEAAAAVERELPGVLASILSTPNSGTGERNVTAETTNALYGRLGYTSETAPADIRQVIASITAELNKAQEGGKGIGGIRDEVQNDASKFAEKLLAGYADPLKDFGSKTARLLEDNANRVADSLAQIHQRLQAVGQIYDQLAATRVGNERQRLLFAGEFNGRGRQLLDSAPLSELEGGFNQRQTRLAGVNGPQAFDPAFIGQQLAELRKNIQEAADRQQAAFERPGGLKNGEYAAAANEFSALTARSANLQQALKHLADTSERNAVVQERLQRLEQEREGRRSLGERFLTAGPEERLRLNQTVALTGRAIERGNLDGVRPEDAREILSFLRGAENVTLPGFKGGLTGGQYARNLIDNSAGGAFRLTKDQQDEDLGLKKEAVARGRTAEDALSELAKHQERGSDQFFKNLSDQQNQFFSRLEKALTANALVGLENKRGRAASSLNDLQGKSEAVSLLKRAGVTTTDQLETLRANAPEIQNLRAAIEERRVANERILGARKAVEGFTTSPNVMNTLPGLGFTGEETDRINARYLERESSRESRDERIRIYHSTAAGSAERESRLSGLYKKNFLGAIDEELTFTGGAVQKADNKTYEPVRKLSGLAGIDARAIERLLSGPDADKFTRAVNSEAFDRTNNRIEDFGGKLAQARTELDRLNDAIRDLRATIKGSSSITEAAGAVVSGFSFGGPVGGVFRPSGTDTVPAMLTPGEFVVSAAAAQANLAVLRQINSGRGAVRLADGGTVSLTPFQDELRNRERARSRQNEIDEIIRQKRLAEEIADRTAPEPRAKETFPQQVEREIREQLALSASSVEVSNRRARGRAVTGLFSAAGAIGSGVKRGDLAVANLKEQVRFGLDSDPTGRLAQLRAEREAATRVTGANVFGIGVVQRQLASDRAAGNLVAGQVAANFNRASALSSGRLRPGEDGQRNIAGRVLAVENRSLEERIATDPSLQRFFGRRFATGGVVTGSGRGDTVPALLTPGEFVLNTAAVGRAGLSNVQRFNNGGLVGPGQSGSSGQGSFGISDEAVRAMNALVAPLSQFATGVGAFGQAAASLVPVLNAFAGNSSALTQAINNIPRNISLTGQHQVSVVINGAEALAKITPEIQNLVAAGVRSEVQRVFKEHLPEAGVRL